MGFDISRVGRDEYYEAVETLFTAFGIEPNADMEDQMLVFLEAMTIYSERTAKNGHVWENYGALANLLQVARKADRLMSQHWHDAEQGSPLEPDLDDAVDLLNYCVFFIRLAREDNWSGTPPTRPQPEQKYPPIKDYPTLGAAIRGS